MNQIDNLMISLLAKQFTVLYGNSGTGKTRLATKLISSIDQTSFITIQVNALGKILSHSEDEIRAMCNTEHLNKFEVRLESVMQTEKVTIQSCQVVKDSSGNNKPSFISGDTEFEIRDAREADRSINLNYRLIPVNSNWLDPRPLIGYVNIFGEAGETEYTLTPFLEMVLLASHPRRRNIPHFIILDEMNLAPVEYYLSDILSLMELPEDLNQPLIPSINVPYLKKYFENRDIDTLDWNLMKEVIDSNESEVQGIKLPKNLYIIGTINIDDTTHTLSNKVLDRAHMIEVHTQPPTILLSNVEEEVTKEQENKFLEFMDREVFTDLNEIRVEYNRLKLSIGGLPEFDQIINDLDSIYNLLKIIDLDFGYRVIKEYFEYLLIGIEFYGTGITSDQISALFSHGIAQKVLSKVHGNRRELTQILQELKIVLDNEPYKNTKLEEKIKTMEDKLTTKGHVSFLG